MDPTFVLGHIRSLVLVIDRFGTIREAYAKPEYSAGYTSEQFVGRNAVEFVAPEEQTEITQVFFDSGGGVPVIAQPPNFQVTLLRVDGNREVFDVMASGFDHDGETGWVVTMTSRTDQPTPHEVLQTIVDGRPLEEVAAAVAARATWSFAGLEVAGFVVLHPQSEFPHVVSPNPERPLSTAVRILVESRNDRIWRDAPHADPIEISVNRLPEIVRAAAELEGMVAVQVGRIAINNETEAVVLWFVNDLDQSGLRGNSISIRRNLVRLLNVAVERNHAAQQLRTAAELDALTGLANRAVFDRTLSAVDSEQATLLFVDLDHFKDVNDNYGHHVGDQVLIEVAERLRSVCRPIDLIARIGGDEFAVLLTNTDRATALGVSKRLLSAIGAPLPATFGPERISASVGLAHQFGALDPQELLESADQAMLSGKRSGRDRVVVAA